MAPPPAVGQSRRSGFHSSLSEYEGCVSACMLHFNLIRTTESVPTNSLPTHYMPDTVKALHLCVYNAHDPSTYVNSHSPDGTVTILY